MFGVSLRQCQLFVLRTSATVLLLPLANPNLVNKPSYQSHSIPAFKPSLMPSTTGHSPEHKSEPNGTPTAECRWNVAFHI